MKDEKLLFLPLLFFPCRRRLLQLLIDLRTIGSTCLLAASWVFFQEVITISFLDLFLNKFKLGVKPE